MSAGRERVLEAAFATVSRFGLAKTTVEDVAREAGVSRATCYRLFPGGRDELFAAMVARELERFFGGLADAVADAPDLTTVLESALVDGHHRIRGHAVLQGLLASEPERLLPVLTAEEGRIRAGVVAFLRPLVEREVQAGRVRPDVDVDTATRYVASLGTSIMATPGDLDLDDPGVVRSLVRHELLGGILVGADVRRDPPGAGR